MKKVFFPHMQLVQNRFKYIVTRHSFQTKRVGHGKPAIHQRNDSGIWEMSGNGEDKNRVLCWNYNGLPELYRRF